jgi:hypothetical protein
VNDHQTVQIDLNHPVFQENLFALSKQDQFRVLSGLHKLKSMTWEQIYRHAGLKLETSQNLIGPHGSPLYSLKIEKDFRALGYREGAWLRFLSLHADYDKNHQKVQVDINHPIFQENLLSYNDC